MRNAKALFMALWGDPDDEWNDFRGARVAPRHPLSRAVSKCIRASSAARMQFGSRGKLAYASNRRRASKWGRRLSNLVLMWVPMCPHMSSCSALLCDGSRRGREVGPDQARPSQEEGGKLMNSIRCRGRKFVIVANVLAVWSRQWREWISGRCQAPCRDTQRRGPSPRFNLNYVPKTTTTTPTTREMVFLIVGAHAVCAIHARNGPNLATSVWAVALLNFDGQEKSLCREGGCWGLH